MPKKTTCQFCEAKYGTVQIYEHYEECLSNIYKNRYGYLISMHSIGITGKRYFNYVIVGTKTRLFDIDNFLRNIWCECCGHDSNFERKLIGIIRDGEQIDVNINVIMSKTQFISSFEEGDVLTYYYDNGSPTIVEIVIVKKLDGVCKIPDKNIDIIFANTEPEIKCNHNRCKHTAKYYIYAKPYCINCTDKYNNKEPKLLIVNSPRSGLCEYELQCQ